MTKPKKAAPKPRAKKPAVDPHKITKPGLYPDIPASAYHADPLPEPSGSAHFLAKIHDSSLAHARLIHPRLNPAYVEKAPSSEMDFGSVAHTLLLDCGRFGEVQARNWATDVAKEKRRELRSLGATPILTRDLERARAMVGVLRHDLAGKGGGVLRDVFDDRAGSGSEVTAAWREDGVWMRARADRWCPPGTMKDFPDGLIVDYKTTGELATAEGWSRKLYSFRADFQGVIYPAGFVLASNQAGANLTKLPRMIFIVQEDEEPFAWSAFELDDMAREHSTGKVVGAFAKFAGAMKSGEWPAYPRQINYVAPPAWEVYGEARRQVAAEVMQRGV